MYVHLIQFNNRSFCISCELNTKELSDLYQSVSLNWYQIEKTWKLTKCFNLKSNFEVDNLEKVKKQLNQMSEIQDASFLNLPFNSVSKSEYQLVFPKFHHANAVALFHSSYNGYKIAWGTRQILAFLHPCLSWEWKLKDCRLNWFTSKHQEGIMSKNDSFGYYSKNFQYLTKGLQYENQIEKIFPPELLLDAFIYQVFKDSSSGKPSGDLLQKYHQHLQDYPVFEYAKYNHKTFAPAVEILGYNKYRGSNGIMIKRQ